MTRDEVFHTRKRTTRLRDTRYSILDTIRTAPPSPCVDDGPALQRAILAARAQERTLLVEAGSYLIGQPLVVPCNQKKGCGGPFRMRGEGMQMTTLFIGKNMTALLTIEPGALTTDRENLFNMTLTMLIDRSGSGVCACI